MKVTDSENTTQSPSPATTTPDPKQILNFQDAYNLLLPEIQSVTDDKLVPMNIDAEAAYTTVKGCLARIRSMRDAIQSTFIAFDLKRFDKLEQYAWAMANALSMYDMASKPTESLPPLAEKGSQLRENLLSDATSLAHRGLIDGARLKELRGPIGYRNLGFDLLDLSNLFRNNWKAIENKTPVELSELNEAHMLADRLLAAVGEREQPSATVAEAAKIRQQAFTLLIKAYDDARRAITYIRWEEDDVDEIAPSLYAARYSSRRKSTGEAANTVVPSTPSTDNPPAARTQAEEAAATRPKPVPVGFPGADPFLHG